MEEIVHVHRKHVPTRWRDAAPGVRVRDYNQKQPLTFEFNGVRLEPPRLGQISGCTIRRRNTGLLKVQFLSQF